MRYSVQFATAISIIYSCGDSTTADLDETRKKEEPFTSARATLLNFEFHGAVETSSSWSYQRYVEDQIFFTVGQLNGNSAVGRLDKLEVTITDKQTTDDGLTRISYEARLPVGWGSKTNLPSTYEFLLPRRADYTGQDEFTEKYKDKCVDWSAHDVDAGSMWYYYRPKRYGCTIDDADIERITAVVTVSEENTTGKYPEYHRVWEDGVLEVIAIFGKNEADDSSNSDAGVAAYNKFLRLMKLELGDEVVTGPADVPDDPGVSVPDVTFTVDRDDSHRVRVVALLIDGVQVAGPEFDARYEALTPTADMVGYFGHSGLGANIRALARKGDFRTGQYQIFFMSGCDTFAYVDSALADAHMEKNPDDIKGTKYLDMVTNAMPAFFSSNASNGRALVRALMAWDAPQPYEEIFTSIDSSQVVVATGEEDNVYFPGYDPDPDSWEGIERFDSVEHDQEIREQTSELEPGDYVFAIETDPDNPGGDADLYVRVGAAPTATQWDCRPYEWGSDESCKVHLDEPSVVHLMVFGYAQGTSHFRLVGRPVGVDPAPGPWDGLDATGTVAKNEEARWVTPQLTSGHYVFTIAGDGDADLYVRAGQAPTLREFDCRPYAWGSDEECRVSLTAPDVIHVMVRGYDAESTFSLEGRPE